MFAKLYETNFGQILVKADTDEDGRPEVRFYFEPDGFGICNQAASFHDNDEGWDNQQKYFDSVDEAVATKLVEDSLNRLFMPLGGL